MIYIRKENYAMFHVNCVFFTIYICTAFIYRLYLEDEDHVQGEMFLFTIYICTVFIYRLYLEDEDHVQGEMYINRAAQLQTQTKNEELQIVYKVAHFIN